jgi:hypothetical protein
MTSRPSTAAPMKVGRFATIALAVFALIVPGLYVGSYLALSDEQEVGLVDGETFVLSYLEREYQHEWQMQLFQPAAQVESWLRRIEVRPVFWPDGPLDDRPDTGWYGPYESSNTAGTNSID